MIDESATTYGTNEPSSCTPTAIVTGKLCSSYGDYDHELSNHSTIDSCQNYIKGIYPDD